LGFGPPSGAHPCDRDHEDDRRREQHGPVDEEKSGSGTVLSASEAPDGSQVARAAHDQGGESEKDERETEPGEVRVCRTRRVEENGQLAKEEIELLDHETKGDETDARTDPGEERALGGEIGTGIGGFVHGDRRGSVIVDRSRRGTGMQAFGSRRGLFVPCPEGASPGAQGTSERAWYAAPCACATGASLARRSSALPSLEAASLAILGAILLVHAAWAGPNPARSSDRRTVVHLGLAALGVRPGGRFAAVLLPSASAGCRGRLCRRGDGRAGDRTERAGRGRLVKRSSTAFGRRLVEWTIVATPIFALSMSSVLDHRLAYDNHGIFYRPYQLDFEHGVMAAEGLGALWFGARSRLGRTFWQAIDASLFTAATTTAMKYAFSRARPYQSSDPHDFFQGNCCQSFPSGEVAYQASVVTPFIAEYRKRDPWIWGLEIFPLYDAVARMKTWGHWQTDVISGFAIGTAWGIFAHEERVPFTVSVLPGGVTVGFDRRF